MKISILDTETTGLSPAEGKLLEVAIVSFDLSIGDVTDARSFLVQGAGDEEIEKTQAIHGIAPRLIREHGLPPAAIQEWVAQVINRSEAILAHNADFDEQWIERSPASPPWVCTEHDIAWPNGSAHMSLVQLALSHGVGVVSAHRAMDDCMTIARVLKRVSEKHDLVALVRYGMRPKATFKAIVSYNDREQAKQAGFRWNHDRKIWWRKMAIEDAEKLNFSVVRI